MAQAVSCNLCGSKKFRVVYEGKSDLANVSSGYSVTSSEMGTDESIVKCFNCGLIYKNPRFPDSTLLRDYAQMIDEKYLEEESGRRISARQILKELKKLKKCGKLLDIGCAVGFLLDEAKKDGWKIYGVELSRWAASFAIKKFGIEIFEGDLKEANFPDKFFDAVVLKDTIEHIINPQEMLAEIRRILKNDGVLCVNTPDINSLISKLLRAKWWGIKQAHLYYFTKKTLYRLLDTAGFKPIKCKSHARTFSLKYWAQRCEAYNNLFLKPILYFLRNKPLANKLIRVNFRDQIEVYAIKSRRFKFLQDFEEREKQIMKPKDKVIVVLPAYNAAKTLRQTVDDISQEVVDEIILVDDASKDATVAIARNLGLNVFEHKENKGYGANQKTCYTQSLKSGADIIVMVHPDYQYDPKVIPQLIKPIQEGKADAVFGSRMMKGGAIEGGMPRWKFNANILLTALENVVIGIYLTEYHSGFRAYSKKYLSTVNFLADSDGFVFDTEIIVQGVIKSMRLEEIPIRTRYFDEASTIKLWPSIVYGLGILKALFKYILHTKGIIHFKQFE